MSEILIYGLPKGETRAHMKHLLSYKCANDAEAEAVKARATAYGWHSFRTDYKVVASNFAATFHLRT